MVKSKIQGFVKFSVFLVVILSINFAYADECNVPISLSDLFSDVDEYEGHVDISSVLDRIILYFMLRSSYCADSDMEDSSSRSGRRYFHSNNVSNLSEDFYDGSLLEDPTFQNVDNSSDLKLILSGKDSDSKNFFSWITGAVIGDGIERSYMVMFVFIFAILALLVILKIFGKF